jgi:hypothetical protein
MKLWMWWVASSVWALYFVLIGLSQFRAFWREQGSFLELLNPLDVGLRLETLLSGVGAWTVAAIPLYVTSLAQRFQRSRERHRLEREREKIEKRLAALDREEAAKKRLAEESRGPQPAKPSSPPPEPGTDAGGRPDDA